MRHEEFIRTVPEADTAVMFVHGIAGTSNHFRDLIPLVELVPDNWSVYNVLLPGHGKTVMDFGRSSMKQWKKHVWDVFHSLSQEHDRVILVGHSMGTLFSIQLALEFPERIPFMLLLAVPLRPYVGPDAVNDSIRLAFGKLRPHKPLEASIGVACGPAPTRQVWKYLTWIPRLVELLLEIRHTDKILPGLKVPCVVFQSRHDELVWRTSTHVLRQKGVEDVRLLPDSGHFYYAPEDRELVRREFLKQMKKKA